MRFLHEGGRPGRPGTGISLLATGCADEACNCPAGRAAAPMCEVCSTAHPGHPGHPYASPAAVSCNHQGRPIFSAGRPGRPGAGSRIPARACPRSSAQEQALPEVVLSMVRSYAWARGGPNRRGDRRSADRVAAGSPGASPFALTSAPAPRHATISVAKTSLW